MIGRSLLANGTIPQEELEAMTIGSNLLWICRKALEGWLDYFYLFGDSVIAICWVFSEKKRLSIFHRNRVNQIRMNTPLEAITHVGTNFNPADIGSRPEKLEDTDIGPDSIWENGYEWMTESLENAISKGIVTPPEKLTLKDEEEPEFDRGVIIERVPEVLVSGRTFCICQHKK